MRRRTIPYKHPVKHYLTGEDRERIEQEAEDRYERRLALMEQRAQEMDEDGNDDVAEIIREEAAKLTAAHERNPTAGALTGMGGVMDDNDNMFLGMNRKQRRRARRQVKVCQPR